MDERETERETEPKNGLFLIKHDEQFSSSLPTKNYLTSVLFVFFSLNPHRFRFGVAFVWFSCGGVGGGGAGGGDIDDEKTRIDDDVDDDSGGGVVVVVGGGGVVVGGGGTQNGFSGHWRKPK